MRNRFDGLRIAVDDAGAVRGIDPARDLAQQILGLGDRQPRVARACACGILVARRLWPSLNRVRST
jgi:hypothetical protein